MAKVQLPAPIITIKFHKENTNIIIKIIEDEIFKPVPTDKIFPEPHPQPLKNDEFDTCIQLELRKRSNGFCESGYYIQKIRQKLINAKIPFKTIPSPGIKLEEII